MKFKYRLLFLANVMFLLICVLATISSVWQSIYTTFPRVYVNTMTFKDMLLMGITFGILALVCLFNAYSIYHLQRQNEA